MNIQEESRATNDAGINNKKYYEDSKKISEPGLFDEKAALKNIEAPDKQPIIPSNGNGKSQKLEPHFDLSKISLENIKNDAEQLIGSNNGKEQNRNLFIIKTVNEWLEQAKNRPIPKMLFGEFWFEHELCILFSDTNLGKSCLAVQIANSISKGNPIPGFKMEAKRQEVLYFDFEFFDKQFEVRYSNNNTDHYSFDNYLYRAEIDPERSDYKEFGFDNFEKYLYYSLEDKIISLGTKILIVDNLTYLKDETEKAKSALPLMKYLQMLKKKHELSILALAHTPKRDLSKPITRNDLQGSKMLINFCDSSFAIGESTSDKNLRYLKQIKARNTEIIYDTENVILCQIEKPDNFLQFSFLDYSSEKKHLKEISEKDRETRIQEAVELKKQGFSNVEIANKFGVSEGAVRKWLKKQEEIAD
jgi:hypothetical protein